MDLSFYYYDFKEGSVRSLFYRIRNEEEQICSYFGFEINILNSQFMCESARKFQRDIIGLANLLSRTILNYIINKLTFWKLKVHSLRTLLCNASIAGF